MTDAMLGLYVERRSRLSTEEEALAALVPLFETIAVHTGVPEWWALVDGERTFLSQRGLRQLLAAELPEIGGFDGPSHAFSLVSPTDRGRIVGGLMLSVATGSKAHPGLVLSLSVPYFGVGVRALAEMETIGADVIAVGPKDLVRKLRAGAVMFTTSQVPADLGGRREILKRGTLVHVHSGAVDSMEHAHLDAIREFAHALASARTPTAQEGAAVREEVHSPGTGLAPGSVPVHESQLRDHSDPAWAKRQGTTGMAPSPLHQKQMLAEAEPLVAFAKARAPGLVAPTPAPTHGGSGREGATGINGDVATTGTVMAPSPLHQQRLTLEAEPLAAFARAQDHATGRVPDGAGPGAASPSSTTDATTMAPSPLHISRLVAAAEPRAAFERASLRLPAPLDPDEQADIAGPSDTGTVMAPSPLHQKRLIAEAEPSAAFARAANSAAQTPSNPRGAPTTDATSLLPSPLMGLPERIDQPVRAGAGGTIESYAEVVGALASGEPRDLVLARHSFSESGWTQTATYWSGRLQAEPTLMATFRQLIDARRRASR